ncbi:MAG: hypothetical protein H6725_15730 [Sandaracinaceae bacterium]|nr:hypothetical protein [Sandaracinaceae bacterium]
MDTHELETILTRRDLAAAESARDHVGPHSMFLANYYWRTQDWIERSLVVHMVQDQRGPHLRSLFSDFLRAPEPPAEYADHVELTKAVCLVQLAGDLTLFARYEQDRELLRRAIQAEVGGENSAPLGTAAPLGASAPLGAAAPRLLGKPTPIAPPDARSAGAPRRQAASEAPPAPAALNAVPAVASPAAWGVVVGVFVLVLIGAGVSFAIVSQSGSGPAAAPAPVSPASAP